MSEPPADGEAQDEDSRTGDRGLGTRGWKRGSWMALIVPAAVLGSVVSAGLFFAQSSDALAPARMTMVVAAVTLAEAIGAAAARYVAATVRIQLALAGIGAVAMALAAAKPSFLFSMIVALSFLVGLAQPLRATTIQQMTGDAARARMASVASAADKIAAAVMLLCAGVSKRSS